MPEKSSAREKKQIISHILAEIAKNRKTYVGSRERKNKQEQLEKYWEEENNQKVICRFDDSGEIAFYLFFKENYIPLTDEHFLAATRVYCAKDSKWRRIFYREFKKHVHSYKNHKKIKKVITYVNSLDHRNQRYFGRSAKLGYVEMFGTCFETTKALEGDPCHELDIKVRQLKKSEIPLACKLENLSHLNDSSSLLHQTFKIKLARGLYERLTTKRNCISAWNGKELVGLIGLSTHKNTGLASIATIAVHPDYQGQGIGKILYFAFAKKLQSIGYRHYLGFSTTTSVLSLASRLKRREVARAFVTKI